MWDVRGECEIERVILWCGGYVMHCSSCGHWHTGTIVYMSGASGSVGQMIYMQQWTCMHV